MSASQRPTVGRIVHYQPDRYLDGQWWCQTLTADDDVPLAAVVSSVDPGAPLVTLTVFQATRQPHALGRMVSEGTGPGTWSWPPRT